MIEVDHVSKAFLSPQGRITALDDIVLNIGKGDVFGIIGLSGAGKSTLMRCLVGLDTPSQGRILFDGHDLARADEAEKRLLRRQFGMIFQHFNLISARTTAENISYPLEIYGVPKEKRRERIAELLDLVGLSHRADAYPNLLSGGEKQRTGIARALANRPEVLFCDEATSALDPKSTQGILQLLLRLNRELSLTIVVITHEMEVIRQVCNKVAVLEGGKVVEVGSVLEVFTRPQHPTTRHFVETMTPQIPPSLLSLEGETHRLIRLTFQGASAGEPVISRLIKLYPVEVNILLGGIHYLQATPVGNLVLSLSGEATQIEKAIAFLRHNDIFVEGLSHDS